MAYLHFSQSSFLGVDLIMSFLYCSRGESARPWFPFFGDLGLGCAIRKVPLASLLIPSLRGRFGVGIVCRKRRGCGVGL